MGSATPSLAHDDRSGAAGASITPPPQGAPARFARGSCVAFQKATAGRLDASDCPDHGKVITPMDKLWLDKP